MAIFRILIALTFYTISTLAGQNCLLCAGEAEYSFVGTSSVDDLRIFLELRSRLQKRIKDKEKNKIHFSLGEFYFKTNATIDARSEFKNYIQRDAGSVGALIAGVYLYKIADLKKFEKTKQRAKEGVLKPQFAQLFEGKESLTYRSLFKNEYEIRYAPDKIEVFLNGNLFEEITP